jgi:hypothetical protein
MASKIGMVRCGPHDALTHKIVPGSNKKIQNKTTSGRILGTANRRRPADGGGYDKDQEGYEKRTDDA